MLPSASKTSTRGLSWLIAELDALHSVVDEATCRRLLTEAALTEEEVASYVEPRPGSYARRCVARRERYEVLVLTWMPGQGSVAHDHSGSLCGLKVVQGQLTEQLYRSGPDGQVRCASASSLGVGQITVDPGIVVHALSNSADPAEILVTVHIYSPPLPEVRRYAVATTPPAAVFLRKKPDGARTVAVIGGGFTGAMTLANLLRRAPKAKGPYHFILLDKLPAAGEGIAYRTNDARHLLNVPAGKMSAWPDRPDDFLNFARARAPSTQPGDFLPRKLYGQYVRQTLLDLADRADTDISVEMVRDDAASLASRGNGWTISTAKGRAIDANVVIVALGHRPPSDEFQKRWIGPRHRFVSDPWAALVLSQIGPDESVLLLGSGLTAVDAILTLDRPDRTAPLVVVSRRGLLPQSHTRESNAPADCSKLLAGWLDDSKRLTARELVRTLRDRAASEGGDWRQVIDGLRPSIAKIWGCLDLIERERFLRHARPFWEVHRHRMAPEIAEKLVRLRAAKILDSTAGALLSAEADANGINVTLSCRGRCDTRKLRVAWIINCTGPGVQNRHTTHPVLRPLIQSGLLCDDPLGLGIPTDPEGRALRRNGKAHANLLVAGTLRKTSLWESTAVPELRQQAAKVAEIALNVVTIGLSEADNFSI
jgi:uncharacterized NAD(P)/FAD-binding protein YdhS/predicted metal-dependent enzyme (double-stranded beta helix superfamily)